MIDFEKIKKTAVEGTFDTVSTVLRGNLVDFWANRFEVCKEEAESREAYKSEILNKLEERKQELKKELLEDNNSKYTSDTIVIDTYTYAAVATSVSIDDKFENHLSSLSTTDFDKLKNIIEGNGGEVVAGGSLICGFKYARKLDAPTAKELANKLRELKTISGDINRIREQDKEVKENNSPNNDDLVMDAIKRLKNK